MVIDVHCHYTFTARAARDADRFSFEAAERDGVHAYDSFVSPRAQRRLSFRLLRRALEIGAGASDGDETDRRLEQVYARHLAPGGGIDRYVLLAFDAYHDDEGRRPPPPASRSDVGSDIYTSNTLVRAACAASGGSWLFGASVHPYRDDALGCVDEVAAAGACLLKWIPLHQNINVADPRTLAVLRRCAELGLPLLLHYSEEFTLATQHREYQDVSALLDVLRGLRRAGRMPTTIVAHVATPVTGVFGPRHDHELLVEALLDEFADDPLYADISALTAWGKTHYLRSVARRQELHGKLLFGSDFPVPLAMPRLRRDLGGRYAAVRAIESWPQQALAVYRDLGFNEIVFHRAAGLLRSLPARPSHGA